eukprot:9472632-Pyramimonas_sp.AAC.1
MACHRGNLAFSAREGVRFHTNAPHAIAQHQEALFTVASQAPGHWEAPPVGAFLRVSRLA